MPAIHDATVNGEKSRMWNIDAPVISGTYQRGMNVKLCQYLLFKGVFLPSDEVDGVWGPRSATALQRMIRYENRQFPDKYPVTDRIDPMLPGVYSGSISRRAYLMFGLNDLYYNSIKGMSMWQGVARGVNTVSEVSNIIGSMPDEEHDMPADLRAALLKARAEFIAQL